MDFPFVREAITQLFSKPSTERYPAVPKKAAPHYRGRLELDTEACIACARDAGYTQLELDVVADNAAALALYQSLGFTEYGRNPKGFRSRSGAWQALVLMRLEL